MPSMYAHQRFGELVYECLPEPLRQEIGRQRDLFDIGLQGPDIFFYYDPLRWGAVPQYGNRLHEQSGRTFFTAALEGYAAVCGEEKPDGGREPDQERMTFEKGPDNRKNAGAYPGAQGRMRGTGGGNPGRQAGTPGRGPAPGEVRSYLYGVLCHYSLDSTCHPYIDAVDLSGAASHAALEGDYDRHLIALEGRDPVKEDVSRSIHPSKRAAAAIAVIYPEADERQVLRSLQMCVVFQRLVRCPHDGKRKLFCRILRKLGKYESLRPHIMNKEPDPACAEAEEHLDGLLAQAVPEAAGRITGMAETLTEMEKCQGQDAPADSAGEGVPRRDIIREMLMGEDYAADFSGVRPGRNETIAERHVLNS